MCIFFSSFTILYAVHFLNKPIFHAWLQLSVMGTCLSLSFILVLRTCGMLKILLYSVTSRKNHFRFTLKHTSSSYKGWDRRQWQNILPPAQKWGQCPSSFCTASSTVMLSQIREFFLYCHKLVSDVNSYLYCISFVLHFTSWAVFFHFA